MVALGEGNTDNLVALENTPNYETTRDYTKLKSDDITKVWLPIETLVK